MFDWKSLKIQNQEQLKQFKKLIRMDMIRQFNNNMQEQQAKPPITKQLIRCLTRFANFAGANTQLISGAQVELFKLSALPEFFQHLLQIPILPDISPEVANASVIYMSKFVERLKKLQMDKELQSDAEAIIQFIITAQADYRIKKQMGDILRSILKSEDKKDLMVSMRDRLVECLQTAMGQQNPSQINFDMLAILFDTAVLHMPILCDRYTEFIIRIYPNVLKINYMVSNLAAGFLTSWDTLAQTNHILSIIGSLLDVLLKCINNLYLLAPNSEQLINRKQVLQVVNFNLGLNLPNNQQQIPIFYVPATQVLQKQKIRIIQLFHKVKTRSIKVIQFSCVILKSLAKISMTQYTKTQVSKATPQYINGFVNAVTQLLGHNHYYQFQSRSIISLLQTIYLFLMSQLKIHDYYNVYLQLKTQIIFGCIFKTLEFSPNDYQNFKDNPDQFIHTIYQMLEIKPQIIQKKNQLKKERDQQCKKVTTNGRNDDKMEIEEREQQSEQNNLQRQRKRVSKMEIQQQDSDEQQYRDQIKIEKYDNLKTLATKFFHSYLQHMDGSIKQLCIFCTQILYSQTAQTVYKKDLTILAICLMKGLVADNNTLKFMIIQVLIKLISKRVLPTKEIRQKTQTLYQSIQENVLYALNLIALEHYYQLLTPYVDELFNSLFYIMQSLATTENIEEVCQLLIPFMLKKLLKYNKDEDPDCHKKTVLLLNLMINPSNLNDKFIDALEDVLKSDQYQLRDSDDAEALAKIINNFGNIILLQLKEQQLDEGMLIKQWSILQVISSHKSMGPYCIDYLQATLSRVFPFMGSTRQQFIQRKVFGVWENILSYRTSCTPFYNQLMGIIKYNFYNGPYKLSLEMPYRLLQDLLLSRNKFNIPLDFQQLRELIQMSIASATTENVDNMPRVDLQFVEGILLMQGLITSFAYLFSKQLWIVCLQTMYLKLKQPGNVRDFLLAQVTTNISLILAYAHGCFTETQINKSIDIVNSALAAQYFSYKDSAKTFATSMTQLLTQIQVPFVRKNFVRLLKTIITVLVIAKQGKYIALKEEEGDEQIYFNLKKWSITAANTLDQFAFFSEQMQKIRLRDPQLYQSSISNLQPQRKNYLKEVLKIRKVKNEARVIYKVKSNT